MTRKILVPVDLTEESEIVLERGRFYQGEGDELVLCHVVLDPSEVAGFHIPHLSTEIARKELMEVATKDMEEFIEDYAPGTPYRLVMGAPAREIIRLAEEEEADLLVIGSHRAGAWAHLFVSNASEKVIRDAMCEVVVVPLRIDSEEQLIRRRAKRKKDREGGLGSGVMPVGEWRMENGEVENETRDPHSLPCIAAAKVGPFPVFHFPNSGRGPAPGVKTYKPRQRRGLFRHGENVPAFRDRKIRPSALDP